MTVNLGFFINKFLRLINRPALRNCQIDKTAKVGTGSNCIGVTMGRYSYMGRIIQYVILLSEVFALSQVTVQLEAASTR